MSGAVSNSVLTEELEWMGIGLRLPPDWQVVRHSLEPKVGKLDLIDRRRERLTLSWTECRSPPDLGRLISDYQDRERLTDAGIRFEPLRRLGHWRGFRRTDARERTLHRAVRYDTTTSRLIELLFVSYPDDDEPDVLVERVVGSVRVSPQRGVATRWRAFGVDVATPPNFRLVAVKVKPGDVWFSFKEFSEDGNKPTGAGATLRRLGMVESWHNGDLEGLVVANRKNTRFSSFKTLLEGRSAALLAGGVKRAPPLRRVLGRLPQHRVLAWRSPGENAIYELSTEATSELSPFAFSVRAEQVPPGMGA